MGVNYLTDFDYEEEVKLETCSYCGDDCEHEYCNKECYKADIND